LLELAGQLRRGFGVRLSLTERRLDLACRDRAQISASRLGCHAQRLLRGAKLGGRELIGGDPCARRHGHEVQQAADDLPLDVELDRCRDIGEGKAQGRWPARLDGNSLGDAEPVIGRLQAEIVEERDLHRGVGAERPVQQFRRARTHRGRVLRRPDLHDVLVQAGARNRGHHFHPAVRRESPARAERCGHGDEDREAHAPKVREHGSFPCLSLMKSPIGTSVPPKTL
jgi:hypothetical protein